MSNTSRPPRVPASEAVAVLLQLRTPFHWLVVLAMGAALVALAGCRLTPTPSAATATLRPVGGVTGAAPQASRSPTARPSPTPTIPAPTRTATPSPTPDRFAGRQLYVPGLREASRGDLTALQLPTQYRIEVRLDEAARRLTVHQETRYINRQKAAQPVVYFRLLPNERGSGGTASIQSLTAAGRRAGWAVVKDGTIVQVELEPALAPNEPIDLVMDYEVTVPTASSQGFGAFVYRDGIFSLDHFYAWMPVCDNAGWHLDAANPVGDMTFTDAALYDVSVTAPEALAVVANGQEVESVANADGTKTWRFAAGPARDFTLVAGRGIKSVAADVDGVHIVSYYAADHEPEAAAALKYAGDALRVFQRRFGPYPYTQFIIAESPIGAVGMEYPGMILIATHVYRPLPNSHDWPLEFAVVHEVAHQWWYGIVGSDQQGEPWLDEAPATYAPILYYEDVYGAERAKLELNNNIFGAYSVASGMGLEKRVRLPVASFTEADYFYNVYAKGGMFFDALRQQVGDDVFGRILKDYAQEFRFKNAHSDDLLRIAERDAGVSLALLFRKWGVDAEGGPGLLVPQATATASSTATVAPKATATPTVAPTGGH